MLLIRYTKPAWVSGHLDSLLQVVGAQHMWQGCSFKVDKGVCVLLRTAQPSAAAILPDTSLCVLLYILQRCLFSAASAFCTTLAPVS